MGFRSDWPNSTNDVDYMEGMGMINDIYKKCSSILLVLPGCIGAVYCLRVGLLLVFVNRKKRAVEELRIELRNMKTFTFVCYSSSSRSKNIKWLQCD